MARKNHYENMGSKITPGIIIIAVIIIIIKIIVSIGK